MATQDTATGPKSAKANMPSLIPTIAQVYDKAIRNKLRARRQKGQSRRFSLLACRLGTPGCSSPSGLSVAPKSSEILKIEPRRCPSMVATQYGINFRERGQQGLQAGFHLLAVLLKTYANPLKIMPRPYPNTLAKKYVWASFRARSHTCHQANIALLDCHLKTI